MVQAGKTHDALLFDPDGPFIPELDGRDRAVPGTQAAADAAVLHMEMVRLAHGRIFDAINGLCKPKWHFALHEVAGRAALNQLNGAVDLRLCGGVDALHFFFAAQIKQRRPGIRHLDAEFCRDSQPAAF